MRKNGWETPFHVLQLATWVVFPAVMALFFAFYTPILDKTPAIVLSVVYAAACLVTVVSVAVCTGTDPSDDCIMRPSTLPDARDSRPDNRVYCNVCTKYVNDQSRHCRLCDKCVDVFDHHCKWLNNCVGKKNYRFFLGSVVGASVFLAVQIAVGIYLVVELYTNEDDIMGNSATSYGCSTEKDDLTGLCVDGQYSISLQTLRIIHIVLLAFLSPWLFMIGQLALFHFHLCMENITTYDYIVRQRKRKNAQERQNITLTNVFVCFFASCIVFVCRFVCHGGNAAVDKNPILTQRRTIRSPVSTRQAIRVRQAKACAARKRNWPLLRRKWTTAWRCSATRAARSVSAIAVDAAAVRTASGGATVARSGDSVYTSILLDSDLCRLILVRMASYIRHDQKAGTRVTWQRRTLQGHPLRLYHHALMRVAHTFPTHRWTKSRQGTEKLQTSLFRPTRCRATRLWSCMDDHRSMIPRLKTTSCKCVISRNSERAPPSLTLGLCRDFDSGDKKH
ncbi:hypothetical protein F441_17043 [Phytophthora nicotianae CJ01A1]|uniref:Palmitoyltransferase n=4 Tax=Phytophthora nicotianae TaxID=4792 RepID=W2MMY9_PHYNI|nr:hypothetical protein L915_16710 [Phytophthora nicotianae]ETM36829.1 hypothetical protein L914_16545 [Phytophthora nicotianae]ETP06576.1 hypothetical protein F441_17043 [Phytophthora nicotianae CJ01A1]